MRETDLYPAVKAFLTARGWSIKGEVGGCDAVGTREGPAGSPEPNQVLIAELKQSLSMDLLLQAVDRMRAADEVWIAVPATRRGRDRDVRAVRLCRLLGLGLLAIRNAQAECLAEPGPYRPRQAVRRRASLTREHAKRQGDPTPGGITRTPIMTAYRQTALAYAAAMQTGPVRTQELGKGSATLLRRNVYGWFARVDRGVYALTEAGLVALQGGQ